MTDQDPAAGEPAEKDARVEVGEIKVGRRKGVDHPKKRSWPCQPKDETNSRERDEVSAFGSATAVQERGEG
jgi:hypothetical protein